MRSFTLAVLLLLAGCDAWPTVVDNQTRSAITVRYRHRDYSQWSAPFPIEAGLAMPLARAHWLHDIVDIRIQDGNRSYSLSGSSIRHLESACPSTKLGRKYGFSPNCYLVYLGKGRMSVTAQQPQNLQYEQIENRS